tara:strand:- start:12645 stop:12950 length:306 start_codon:yes stop_codon:yes gene_type:complete
MAHGKLNANGSTGWLTTTTKEGANTNILLGGAFGGGTLAVEKRVNGTTYPLYDGGVAITLTAADDNLYNLAPRTQIRLTLSGATAPSIDWEVPGTVEKLGS